MKLIFEKGAPGQHLTLMPACDVPEAALSRPRTEPLELPHVSETELTRHYTALAKRVHGVNDGFYPLGSCTMKYNPKINEDMANLPGFAQIHPLQPEGTVQGCLEVLDASARLLGEITGMDAMTFQPAAGAHGEFTGLLLIKAYHTHRNDTARTKIIVPDSAHGTNPASAVMAGFTVVNIPSGPDGCVDVEALRQAVGADTAGLMLTNPNTVGIFDKNILEITKIVHDAGGLCYYDGANLNAVMGVVRPGDMGFDVIHLNLHKTFSTPRRRRTRLRRRGLQKAPGALPPRPRCGSGRDRLPPGPARALHWKGEEFLWQLRRGGPGPDLCAHPGAGGHPGGGEKRGAQRQLHDEASV